MAHTFTQQTGGNTAAFGQRQGSAGFGNQPRPQQPPHQKRGQQPRPQQHHQSRGQHQPHQQAQPGPSAAKKGYVNLAIEMPDELMASFREKNAADGKTGPEVIIQLISLYNTGKVTL